MSTSLNKVMIIGNLGKDPEVKAVGQSQVANFSIATNEGYKDKNGQKVDKTEWHKVVAWGKLAEIIEKYVKKGMTIYIEGKLETLSWDDKNGQKHYTTQIRAESMLMLSRGDSATSKKEPMVNVPKWNEFNGYTQNSDDDLPF